ncbi:hypothetical protein CR513_54592, partial [Mucuna pruriens]
MTIMMMVPILTISVIYFHVILKTFHHALGYRQEHSHRTSVTVKGPMCKGFPSPKSTSSNPSFDHCEITKLVERSVFTVLSSNKSTIDLIYPSSFNLALASCTSFTPCRMLPSTNSSTVLSAHASKNPFPSTIALKLTEKRSFTTSVEGNDRLSDRIQERHWKGRMVKSDSGFWVSWAQACRN